MRSLMKLLAIGVAAVAIAAFGVSAQSASKSTGVPAPPGKAFKAQADARGPFGTALQGTIINTGILASGPVRRGFVDIDAPTTFNCARGGTGNCKYELQAFIQFHNSASNNPVAVCFLIDGLYVNGGCFYSIGRAPTGFFSSQVSAQIHQFGVPQGTHTVQTQIFTQRGLDYIHFYDLKYSNYSKPD